MQFMYKESESSVTNQEREAEQQEHVKSNSILQPPVVFISFFLTTFFKFLSSPINMDYQQGRCKNNNQLFPERHNTSKINIFPSKRGRNSVDRIINETQEITIKKPLPIPEKRFYF